MPPTPLCGQYLGLPLWTIFGVISHNALCHNMRHSIILTNETIRKSCDSSRLQQKI